MNVVTTLHPQLSYVDVEIDLRLIGCGVYPRIGVVEYTYWGA